MLEKTKYISLLFTFMLLVSCNGSGGTSGVTAGFSVGGIVTGLTGAVVLQNNNSDNLTVSNNGQFTFATPVTNGSSYRISIFTQPAGQTCTVTGDSGTITANLSSVVVTCAPVLNSLSTLMLTLPNHSIKPNNLAVIVASGDALSKSVAGYYQTARGIPAENMITVNVPTGSDTISDSDFAILKAAIDAQLSNTVQATLLTWTAPSRVVGKGSCVMSITSAMAFGFNPKYCANSCAETMTSSYFDSESAQPWQDFQMRPSMMLGVSSLTTAKALIDLGVSADSSQPPGDGYLIRTSDAARSVRFTDYLNLPYLYLPSVWSQSPGIQLNYIDNSTKRGDDSISGKSDVLFYFTGLTRVPNITTNRYRAGAIADSLTSFGGYLPGGNGQMPIQDWLSAGVTASYGTVAEPCNYTRKFSQASVLIDHYYRGATLIEAYWKAVSEPGQGLFVGEPLAQPYRDTPDITINGGQYVNGGKYVISTRSLRPNSNYALEYLSASSINWTTLASFKVARAQAQVLYAPLPPSNAIQIRWVGPCATNANKQCTLSTSN